MLYNILTFFLGSILFLFLFWRRLKEDYSSSLIFSASFLVIWAILVSQLLTVLFLPVWWFWSAMFASILALGFGVRSYKLKLFETIDAAVGAFLPWLDIIFLIDSIKRKSYYSLGAFFVVLAVYLLYVFLNANYKKFSWYKSGKVGFSGLGVIMVIFLLRGLSSLFLVDMLSFVGNYDVIISIFISILCFLGLIHLRRLT